MTKYAMKYIFLGSGHFAKIVLAKLIEAKKGPFYVVTEEARPAGRGKNLKETEVMSLAKKKELKITDKFNPKEIADLKPELLLVSDFGKILPKELTAQKDFKTINIHPSFLPKYRGPSPIQTSILNGDKESGATIIELDQKIDHGPIVACKKLAVKGESYAKLLRRLASLGAKLFLDFVPAYLSGKIKLQAQNEKEALMTKKINKEDGKIDFSKEAGEIEKMIRAFEGWPGAYCSWDNRKKQLKIKSGIASDELPQPPFLAGTVFKTKNGGLAVACGQGSLVIEKLQLEGKNEMKASEFLNGYSDIIGGTLR